MLREFQNKTQTKTLSKQPKKKKINVYGQDVITDRQVWNWFSMFRH